GAGVEAHDLLRWFGLTWLVARELWDDELCHDLSTRALQLSRESGALIGLPLVLSYRAAVHLHAGEFAAASALPGEAASIETATGSGPAGYWTVMLAVWRGVEEPAVEKMTWGLANTTERAEGRGIGGHGYASAVLYNGLGHYGAALAGAQRACEYDDL